VVLPVSKEQKDYCALASSATVFRNRQMDFFVPLNYVFRPLEASLHLFFYALTVRARVLFLGYDLLCRLIPAHTPKS
jgi:hypothetical protein